MVKGCVTFLLVYIEYVHHMTYLTGLKAPIPVKLVLQAAANGVTVFQRTISFL